LETLEQNEGEELITFGLPTKLIPRGAVFLFNSLSCEKFSTTAREKNHVEEPLRHGKKMLPRGHLCQLFINGWRRSEGSARIPSFGIVT
jgi:hypothetical protein